MTQLWSGEIRLPIAHTPARVLPIRLSNGALISLHAPPNEVPPGK